MTLEETLERFLAAASAMARGDPEAVKAMYSERDDITLANPFGHAVRGRAEVVAALDYVSSRFSDGEVSDVITITATRPTTSRPSSTSSTGGRALPGERNCRSSTFGSAAPTGERTCRWRLVHRHADPIASFDEAGPVRRTTSVLPDRRSGWPSC